MFSCVRYVDGLLSIAYIPVYPCQIRNWNSKMKNHISCRPMKHIVSFLLWHFVICQDCFMFEAKCFEAVIWKLFKHQTLELPKADGCLFNWHKHEGNTAKLFHHFICLAVRTRKHIRVQLSIFLSSLLSMWSQRNILTFGGTINVWWPPQWSPVTILYALFGMLVGTADWISFMRSVS